eukprot:1523874-Rhodomonas_salina.1
MMAMILVVKRVKPSHSGTGSRQQSAIVKATKTQNESTGGSRIERGVKCADVDCVRYSAPRRRGHAQVEHDEEHLPAADGGSVLLWSYRKTDALPPSARTRRRPTARGTRGSTGGSTRKL